MSALRTTLPTVLAITPIYRFYIGTTTAHRDNENELKQVKRKTKKWFRYSKITNSNIQC